MQQNEGKRERRREKCKKKDTESKQFNPMATDDNPLTKGTKEDGN